MLVLVLRKTTRITRQRTKDPHSKKWLNLKRLSHFCFYRGSKTSVLLRNPTCSATKARFGALLAPFRYTICHRHIVFYAQSMRHEFKSYYVFTKQKRCPHWTPFHFTGVVRLELTARGFGDTVKLKRPCDLFPLLSLFWHSPF